MSDTTLGQVMDAHLQPDADQLAALGVKIGKLYTDKGLPPDMALERLGKHEQYTQLQLLAIINGVCSWLLEHKRNSGATDKAIERQRKANHVMVERYITTGELGAY